MYKYKIQSVIVSPDAWLFGATTAKSLSDSLSFQSPKKHGETRHIVSYLCEAENLDKAWRLFFKEVEEFVEATALQTSSYLSFHDWNHIITNQTKKICMIVVFPRTPGVSLKLSSQERVDDVKIIIEKARHDKKLKNFLHCYRMAILVDAPETRDAYEKYLLFACESLAGEKEATNQDGYFYKKYDKERLIKIIGKELHKYFFSSINPIVGRTIRNANMHTGKSPNDKPTQTLKLVNKLREFIAKEYDLKALTILKEDKSPTRGLYKDNGQRLFFGGNGIDKIDLQNIINLEVFIKDLPDNVKILSGKEAQILFDK